MKDENNALKENPEAITITVGEDCFSFNVTDAEFNRFIDESMPEDKVKNAYNFLMRTIDGKHKDALKAVVLNGTTPRGVLVVKIATAIGEQFGAGVSVSLKK